MARIGISIQATEEGTEQRPQYENLPNGVYLLQAEAADVAQKDEGTRDHAITVKTTFEVLEPEELKGRKLFNNYNVQHPNTQAQEIGNRQFQCLLRALELTELPDDDTDNLLFKSFTATIGMGRDSKEKNADGTPKWAAKNEIKRYWYPDQGDAPAVGVVEAANDNKPAAKPAAQARPAATGGAKPWGKKAA